MRLTAAHVKEYNEVGFENIIDITGYNFGLPVCFIVLAGESVLVFIASVLVVYWRNKAYH